MEILVSQLLPLGVPGTRRKVLNNCLAKIVKLYLLSFILFQLIVSLTPKCMLHSLFPILFSHFSIYLSPSLFLFITVSFLLLAPWLSTSVSSSMSVSVSPAVSVCLSLSQSEYGLNLPLLNSAVNCIVG